MTDELARMESEFLRALNTIVEPWVVAGAGGPGLIPVGLVVLETTGRRTGEPRTVPLSAYLHAGHLIVGTVRGNRSHWVRNVLAQPRAVCSLWGGKHTVTATVWRPGTVPVTPTTYPLSVRMLVTAMVPLASLGYTFAGLAPDNALGVA